MSKTVLNRVTIVAALSVGCGAASPVAPDAAEVCGGYGDWTTSAYVLPYAAGLTFRVSQGNCSPPGNGHRGVERYGYDFDMPIGTSFVAARSGIVAHVEASHQDGEVAASGFDNYIVIRHSDGTHGLYGHITRDGATVRQGDDVVQGQLIGRSGNTGNTNNMPHLHLSVHACDPVTSGSAACASQPVTFRNTAANPAGLAVNRSYTASGS